KNKAGEEPDIGERRNTAHKPHRTMKPLHLLSCLALLLGTLHVSAQPQWRFHLAFEDAIGAKDTIWFVYDTTASIRAY
ncbi:hypothetical protein V6O07_03590, partial [Arthrospira platensis SPKY2]